MVKMHWIEVLLVSLGLLCILGGVALFLLNLYADNQAKAKASSIVTEFESKLVQSGLSSQEEWINGDSSIFIPAKKQTENSVFADADMPTMMVQDEEFVGILSISTLSLSLPVYSEWSYQRLSNAPCRYSGTAYARNLVIAAHNYKSHFGSVYSLQAGDTVFFTDASGQVFKYEVAVIETLSASEVEQMVNSNWDLSLFTCTVGGKSRVTVRCVLISYS